MSAASDSAGEGGSPTLPGFLRDPIGLTQRRWKWMVATLALGLTATALFARTLELAYLSTATVLVTSQRISEEFFRPTVESDQLEKVSAILGEIMSRQNLAALIEKYGLYPDKQDADPVSMEDKITQLRTATEIRPDTTHGAVRPGSAAVVYAISVYLDSAQGAAIVANDLAGSFIDTHLKMRSRQARLTTEFLRRELAQVEEDLAKQESAITTFKQQYRGELPGELQTNISRLDRLQMQRQSLALQIAEAETRMTTIATTAPDAQSPQERLKNLRARYQELAAIYTPEHPSVVAAERQMAALEKEVAETPQESAAPGSPASTIGELRRQLAATVAEFEDLDRRVASTPKRQEELAALEQRAEILRESHREFLRKVSQAELAEAVESAQQGERATILDKAVPPSHPDNSPLKYIVVGIIASVLLAAGIGVLLELVDAVVVSDTEIEQRYQLPVLGSIARIR